MASDIEQPAPTTAVEGDNTNLDGEGDGLKTDRGAAVR